VEKLADELAAQNPRIDQIGEEEKKRLRQLLEVLPSAVTDYKIEVWITKDDKRIVKQKASIAIDPEKFIAEMNKQVPEDEQTEFPEGVVLDELTIDASTQIGNGVSIEAPKNATPIDEVIQEVQGALEGSDLLSPSLDREQDAQMMDAQVMSALSTLRPDAELYYADNGNTYRGVCKSENFQRVTNSAVVGRSVTCRDSDTRWIAYAPLENSDKKYFCVDSRGAAEEINEEPTGMSCGDVQASAPSSTAVNTNAVAHSAISAIFPAYTQAMLNVRGIGNEKIGKGTGTSSVSAATSSDNGVRAMVRRLGENNFIERAIFSGSGR